MYHETFVFLTVGFLEPIDQIYDGGGFTRSWWTVQKQIREVVPRKRALYEGPVPRVENYVLEPLGPIFFYPRAVFRGWHSRSALRAFILFITHKN